MKSILSTIASKNNKATTIRTSQIQLNDGMVKTLCYENETCVGGVSIRLLNYLIGSGEIDGNATMEHICSTHIVPNTKVMLYAYVEMLASNPKQSHHVRPIANVCISYSWNYKFVELVEAVMALLKNDKEDLFVWVDALCLSQHVVTSVAEERRMKTFEDALKKIGRCVVVVYPWYRPMNSAESWCVYELAMVVKHNIPYVISLSPDQKKDFEWAILSDRVDYAFFNNVLSMINVEIAKATKEEDRVMILRLLRKVGVAKVNQVIAKLMVEDFFLGTAKEMLERVGLRDDDRGRVSLALYAMYHSMGDLSEALVWSGKAVELYKKVYGARHKEYAAALSNHAAVLVAMGKYEEELKIHQEVKVIEEATIGKEHPNYAITLSNIGVTLCHLERFEEALAMHEESIQIDRNYFGNDSVEVACGLSNKAKVFIFLKRFKEALKLSEEVIRIRRAKLGNEHPEMSTALTDMGALLMAAKRYDEALDAFNQSLAMKQKFYGEEHQLVANSYGWIGTCLRAMGKEKEAKKVGKKALGIWERTLGPNHPDTIDAREKWGD